MDGAEDARLSPLDLFPVIASRHVVISRISRIQRRRRPLLVLVGSDCGRTSLLGPTLILNLRAPFADCFVIHMPCVHSPPFWPAGSKMRSRLGEIATPGFVLLQENGCKKCVNAQRLLSADAGGSTELQLNTLCCYELRSSDLTLKVPRKRQPRGAHGAKLVCHGTPIHGALCVMAHQFLASTSISG